MKEYKLPENLKDVIKTLQQYQPQIKQIKIEPIKPKKKGLSTGAITAIALGGSALVLTGAALGFWFARRRYIAENLCCDITSHGDDEYCCNEEDEYTCECCDCKEPPAEEPADCECCKEVPAAEKCCCEEGAEEAPAEECKCCCEAAVEEAEKENA